MTLDEFVEKSKLVHGSKYDYSKVVFKNATTKVDIFCPEHGIFRQTPYRHVNDHYGCPLCAGNKRSNTFDFVMKAKRVHGDKYDYSLVCYSNNRTPVDIICLEHGVFKQSPSNHLAGKGCPLCANNVLLTLETFIDKAKLIHGDHYDYSRVDYCGNRVPIEIVCPKHGVFKQVPYVHLNGCGCPSCGRVNQVLHRDEAAIRAKSLETCLNRYGVSNPMFDETIREKHKLIVMSDEVNDRRNKTKRTNGSFNVSLPEYRLGVLLRGIFGDNDVVSNYSSELYPFCCDYYVVSRDLYIELNAHWSHGGHWYDVSDESLVDEWRTKSKFYKNAADTFSVRDVEKRNVACKNALNYIVFWKTDLSDVSLWIDSGCPDGQDWKVEYSWLS